MPKLPLKIDTLTHDEATRRNAPTAELEAFMPAAMKTPILAAYNRRNPDLDPQLVWRGKDIADWSDLVVKAPPLYIQEKIHPKAVIEDLKRGATRKGEADTGPDLFADFNGIEPDQRTEFYEHDQHWSNRMIVGDALQVMASLAEREGLKGNVQCIYIDPPYGIKFNSNFQWSTTSTSVTDGKADHLTREPEQVKAFRDTWADGINSYLTYLRDRLVVARDLLSESGSVFVQIGDENVHRVRALMDEVYGPENFAGLIPFATTSSQTSRFLATPHDFVVWYAKSVDRAKFRKLFKEKRPFEAGATIYNRVQLADGVRKSMSQSDWTSNYSLDPGVRVFALGDMTSQRQGRASGPGSAMHFPLHVEGRDFYPGGNRGWSTTSEGFARVIKAGRYQLLKNGIMYVRFHDDYPVIEQNANWLDTASSFASDKIYVVQTNVEVVKRCILMTSDPGDLVLDPTCGSGTTAYVAEQWGRRWVTIDTSRVALALARARLMGARFPWYVLADSPEGQRKEGEVTRSVPLTNPTYGRLRQGFTYKRVPHVRLKSIADNAEIDTIWENYQPRLEKLRNAINRALGTEWQDWQVPRELDLKYGFVMTEGGPSGETYSTIDSPFTWVSDWWELRVARQREIDASIRAKADTEYLYDQPYEDKTRVRVAGPFTVESLSPHRVPAVDVDDSLFNELEASEGRRQKRDGGETADFATMVLANLKNSGVQQAHRADRLVFSSIRPWPGDFICAEGLVRQASEGADEALSSSPERRAAVLVGPEYGTVARADLTAAAREAAEAGFDLLIAAAFNFDAHASEFEKMGALTVLKARINPDLHMPDLANNGAGNLFTVFGEPDIVVHDEAGGDVSIEVVGIDMYKSGQIESSSADDIAVWFVDTDYDYESFFVRHAYFPGANDPYKALKTTLKAEIDADAWESLKRTRSRPFPKPASGRVAVKVINHLGDEVMKVMQL